MVSADHEDVEEAEGRELARLCRPDVKVGYCVAKTPHLASYRLRVAIPAAHLGCAYEIGTVGSPTFFYKHFEDNAALAKQCGPFVYDVVNDHFDGKHGQYYRLMCGMAAAVTCSSEYMAEVIRRHTYSDAVVIDDPYENDDIEPQLVGDGVLWFGHQANIKSLHPYINVVTSICSNLPHDAVVPWSIDSEREQLQKCAVVLMTGDNRGASSNRIVKALRAGKYVVTPGGVPAWDELRDYIWVGDVKEGVRWALNNREEACRQIQAGQRFVATRNGPSLIGEQWKALFASI